MAVNMKSGNMTREMGEYLHIHSFHDGDVVRWADSQCFNDYDRSQRFICRGPRPDADGRCYIEEIAPDAHVDCHGHLSRALTHLDYIEYADEEIDVSAYAVVDGFGATIVDPEGHGYVVEDGIARIPTRRDRRRQTA